MKKILSESKNSKAVILLLLLLLMLCVLLAAGCQSTEPEESAAPPQTTIEEIGERGVLRVGTAGDYMPMSFLDPEAGRYVGFDAELADGAVFI